MESLVSCLKAHLCQARWLSWYFLLLAPRLHHPTVERDPIFCDCNTARYISINCASASHSGNVCLPTIACEIFNNDIEPQTIHWRGHYLSVKYCHSPRTRLSANLLVTGAAPGPSKIPLAIEPSAPSSPPVKFKENHRTKHLTPK